jgi:hypothetical protein
MELETLKKLHLRKETRRWILGVVLAVIIVSFVFFYGYSASEGNMESFVVGRINGESILLSDYKRQLEGLQESYRDQLNDPANGDALGKQLRQQAFNALLQRAFLLQMAKKYNIAPSHFEVLVTVAGMKELRTEDGNFNEQLFKQLPPYYKRRLERDRKNELTINLLEARIVHAAKVPDNELRENFDLMNTKVKVVYAFEPTEGQTGSDLMVPVTPSGGKIERMLTRMKSGQDLVQAAKAEGVQVEATDLFFFGGRIPLSGRSNEYASALEGNPDFYKTAFTLKKGAISPIINVRGGRCVFGVVDYKEPDWSKFPAEAFALKQQILGQKMNDYFSEWFSANIRNAKIQNNLNRLFRE